MKLVYIAGPFRGPTAWDVAENVRNAERVGLEVAKAGHMPVVPHANTQHFHGQLDDAFWLEGTLELLRRCDAVVLVPGWEKSSGTRAEVREARRIGITVYSSVGELQSDVVGLGGIKGRAPAPPPRPRLLRCSLNDWCCLSQGHDRGCDLPF